MVEVPHCEAAESTVQSVITGDDAFDGGIVQSLSYGVKVIAIEQEWETENTLS